MSFPSFAFLFLFLPIFAAGYFALGKRQRNLWLLLCSVCFYGWDHPSWVLIMLGSTVFDFTMGLLLGPKEDARPHRRLLLVLSIVVNLGLLGWFKYANFFVHTAEAALGATIAWKDIALPLGISFYTFQSMSYTIDVYRGDVRPTRSLVDFACYVTMFPQLIAGPIVRYSDVAGQLRERDHSTTLFGAGAACFAIGFVKKVLVADSMAPIANAWLGMTDPGFVPSWTGLIAYSLQIYFDFSGYSDMAIGLGLMLGFKFPRNFDSPYQSQSITEAWRRWHISLSTWLRDYLYVPLGGNRAGAMRTYGNLMATMLLGGLWHGANWPFVLWGAYQGMWLCLERMNGKKPFHAALPRPLRVLVTYVIFTFGWSMFVARDATHLWTLWRGLFGAFGGGQALAVNGGAVATGGIVAGGLMIVFLMPNSATLMRRFGLLVAAGFGVLFVVAIGQMLSGTPPFLYFRF
jgi:alginate O-acetyltransferase complex protein AlgI